MNIDNMKKVINVVKERNQVKETIKSYDEWFQSYDKKVSEHLRCQRLGIACDHNIVELDIIAEAKKSEIKELKNKLSSLKF